MRKTQMHDWACLPTSDTRGEKKYTAVGANMCDKIQWGLIGILVRLVL